METLDVQVVIAPNGRPVYVGDGDLAAGRRYFDACRPWHEAAHVVAMLALGHGVSVATLDPAEAARLSHAPGRPPVPGVGAACAAVAPKRPWSEWPARDVAVGAAAGIVWTAFFPSGGFMPEGDPSAALAAGAGESPADWGLVLRNAPSEAEQRRAVQEARAILSCHQVYVSTIAAALQVRGRLTGEDVALLVDVDTILARAGRVPRGHGGAPLPTSLLPSVSRRINGKE